MLRIKLLKEEVTVANVEITIQQVPEIQGWLLTPEES